MLKQGLAVKMLGISIIQLFKLKPTFAHCDIEFRI